MSRFGEALQTGKLLLMDGAMGTELQRAGLREGECGELWNLTQPDEVRAIHQAYVDAGAECLLTNTFQANPPALARYGRAEDLEALCRAALELARSVAGPDRIVLADIGPVADQWRGPPLAQVVKALCSADALLLETYSDLHALWAVKYVCLPCLEKVDLPVLLSVTYRRTSSGVVTTQGGQPPEVYARLGRQYGIAALGVNCGRDIGMDHIIEIVRRYRENTDLPLFARPNAGTPSRVDDRWIYPLDPKSMADRLLEVLEAGATLVGGCCGTTPEHIAACRPVVNNWNASYRAAGSDI